MYSVRSALSPEASILVARGGGGKQGGNSRTGGERRVGDIGALEGGAENKVGLDNIIIEAEEERAQRVHGSATGG